MSTKRGPRAPDDLPDAAKQLWHDTLRTLLAQGTWSDGDEGALRRYVDAVATAQTMRSAANARPWVEGSTGQLVAHPGFKVAADADRDAGRYASDLLLTPAARRRAGVAGPVVDEPMVSWS